MRHTTHLAGGAALSDLADCRGLPSVDRAGC